jgi:hypothetical protein
VAADLPGLVVTRVGRAVVRRMEASPALRRAVLAGMWVGLAGQVACLGVFALLAGRGGSLVPCVVMAVAVAASVAGVSVGRGWPLTAALRARWELARLGRTGRLPGRRAPHDH